MIVEQFNAVHIFAFTVLPAALFGGLFFGLRGRGGKVKENVLLTICVFNAALYFVYKAYQALWYDGYEFVLVYNLPLHVCNLNLFLLPLAIRLRSRTMTAFQVYFGSPLAFFALFAIDPSFRGAPFLEFTCLTYYYYHGMLTVMPLLLPVFGMFAPSVRDAWKPVLMMAGLTFAIHIINIIMRTTGIADNANYFYTFGLSGDPFTEMFRRLIPFDFFFLLPYLAVVFVPYISAVNLVYFLAVRNQKSG
jgi:uncharacterized membrane protein YwaF